MSPSKLIVGSVRLPVSISRVAGGWSAKASPGGLATALRAVGNRRSFTWIGWPGMAVDREDQPAVRAALATDSETVPVFIEQEEMEGFYEEFSNRILWPLFHNLPGPPHFDRKAWALYQAINERFAAAIVATSVPGDTVWVHDYQLALVPQMLRDRGVDCAIGFFLHTPFPSSENYRTLPVREAILHGMLGANLLGFHTYEYVSHFRTACLRVLGRESEPDRILLPTHNARLGVLPIGIEPDEIAQLSRSKVACEQYEKLRTTYKGKKVVLGVDRLDYTKGLPQKFIAYEEFLRNSPQQRDKVVFIQVAAPSRTGVAEYQSLKRELDELSGQINGRYGTLDSVPLVYINQNVPRDKLTALYRLADVALVTPVRDGMNLVCLEYIAAKGEEPGTLILSEFAGAAACLPGARLVNPHNPSQIAEVLAEVLTSGPSAVGFAHMQEFVQTNTSIVWAEKFLALLEQVYEDFRAKIARLRFSDAKLAAIVRDAERPLFLLDYDGTLQPHTVNPEDAVPTERVRRVLLRLSEWATVYVVSGRPAAVLDAWLGDLPIGMVCEHGLAIKGRGDTWLRRLPVDATGLQETVDPVFRDFTERTPGSKIERKAASISWHYRGADPRFGAWRARELRSLLEERLASLPFSVLVGSRVIEVRHAELSKGAAAVSLLRRHHDADLVFCVGNDRTDEEMFEAVAKAKFGNSIICHVGSVNTSAPYVVGSPAELLTELEALLDMWCCRAS